jgi:hypothetical protein
MRGTKEEGAGWDEWRCVLSLFRDDLLAGEYGHTPYDALDKPG